MPPDRETLAAIAEYTGGDTFDAESADGARRGLRRLGSRVGREERATRGHRGVRRASARAARRRGGRRGRARGPAPPLSEPRGTAAGVRPAATLPSVGVK